MTVDLTAEGNVRDYGALPTGGSLSVGGSLKNSIVLSLFFFCEQDMAQAKCGHAFHRLCVQEYIESAPVAAEADQQPARPAALGCPACFVPLTIDLSKQSGGDSLEDNPEGSTSNAKVGRGKKRKQQHDEQGEGLYGNEQDADEVDTVAEVPNRYRFIAAFVSC